MTEKRVYTFGNGKAEGKADMRNLLGGKGANLAEMTNIGTLCAFIIVSAAVIILRKKNPNQQRAFKCPLVPLVPALAIVFCGILIYMLPLVTQIRFVVWLLIGLAIYFGYGYSHSIISKTRRSAVPAGSAAANMNPAAQPTKGH